jgi:hypothetical protein
MRVLLVLALALAAAGCGGTVGEHGTTETQREIEACVRDLPKDTPKPTPAAMQNDKARLEDCLRDQGAPHATTTTR